MAKGLRFGYILSCYHHCDWVPQCLDSIKKQTYTNWIVVLYADSPDCKDHMDTHPRISFVNDGKNLGQTRRINMGIEDLINSGCDYISFMGVDDYLFNDNVLMDVQASIKHWQIKHDELPVWAYGGHFYEKVDKPGLHFAKQFEYDPKRLRWENYIAGGAVFVRADVIDKLKLFAIMNIGGDWILFNKLAKIADPLLLHIPIYVETIGVSNYRPWMNNPHSIKNKLIRKFKMGVLREYVRWFV